MKRLMLLSASICSIIILFSSCSVVTRQSTAKMMYIKDAGIFANPLMADLKVSESKKTGSASGDLRGKSIEILKNEAITDVLLKNNADVLIEPFIIIETKGRTQTVTVTGYPAIYENFRSIELEKFPSSVIGQDEKGATKQKPTTESLNKKRSLFLFGAGKALP